MKAVLVRFSNGVRERLCACGRPARIVVGKARVCAACWIRDRA